VVFLPSNNDFNVRGTRRNFLPPEVGSIYEFCGSPPLLPPQTEDGNPRDGSMMGDSMMPLIEVFESGRKDQSLLFPGERTGGSSPYGDLEPGPLATGRFYLIPWDQASGFDQMHEHPALFSRPPPSVQQTSTTPFWYLFPSCALHHFPFFCPLRRQRKAVSHLNYFPSH